MNDGFASAVLGMRYSEVFPNGAFGANPGHNAWPALIQSAGTGDGCSLSTLYDFFRRAHTHDPLFAPGGSFSIIEFSVVPPHIGSDIPEPSTVSMIGLTALDALVRALRN